MAHAERIDETLERDLAPRFDGIEQTADRQVAEALLLLQFDFRIARGEGEDVTRLPDPALLEEQRDLLLAQPRDVERAPRDEMLQMLDLLVRAGELPGAAGDHALATGRGRVTHHRGVERTRTITGKLVRLRTFRPILQP